MLVDCCADGGASMWWYWWADDADGRGDFTCVIVQDGCTYRHGTESEPGGMGGCEAVSVEDRVSRLSQTGSLCRRPGVSVTGRASLSNSGRVVGLLIRVIMTHFSRQTRS
jgi:hypothetical protein